MIEILTSGNIEKDFERLGVEVRQTYNGKFYGVCEVTEKEFEKLRKEPDIENTWNNCGWRHNEGSNLGIPSTELLINGKKMIGWGDEEEEIMTVHNNLLEYLEERGFTTFRNISALCTDLAKYNNMKLSELFKTYQN